MGDDGMIKSGGLGSSSFVEMDTFNFSAQVNDAGFVTPESAPLYQGVSTDGIELSKQVRATHSSIGFINLGNSPYEFMDLLSDEKTRIGNAKVFEVDGKSFAIADTSVKGLGLGPDRVLSIYSKGCWDPILITDSGEHYVDLNGGSQIRIDWYDKLGPEGEPVAGDRIKVSYIPAEKVNPAKVGQPKPGNIYTEPMRLFRQLKQTYGADGISFVHLDGQSYDLLDITSNADSRVGSAKIYVDGGEAFAVGEFCPDFEKNSNSVAVYRSAAENSPAWLEAGENHDVKLRNNGKVTIGWLEASDANGEWAPDKAVKVTYSPPGMSRDSFGICIPPDVDGYIATEDGLTFLRTGDKLPIPEQGSSHFKVVSGEKSWLVWGQDGKIMRLVMDGMAPEIAMSPDKAKGVDNPRPVKNHPFVVTPNDEVIFVGDSSIDKAIAEEMVRHSNWEIKAADYGMMRISNPDQFVEIGGEKAPYDPFTGGKKNGPLMFKQNAYDVAGAMLDGKVASSNEAYLIYDKTAGVEYRVGVDPVVGTKAMPEFHMGECLSSGAFNVLGGAMVVVGSHMIEDATGEELSTAEHAALGLSTFYGLAAWMESAAATGSVDWLAFNANFAKATPGAIAVGAPIFYGSSQLVSDAGLDPMGFEGQLATTTIGGAGLAVVLNAQLPAFLTVGGYSTGASLMSMEAIGAVGIGASTTVLAAEGAMVLGAGAVGYKAIGPMVNDLGGRAIYNSTLCVDGHCISSPEKSASSDGSIAGFLADDPIKMGIATAVFLGPVGGLCVYGLGKLIEADAAKAEPIEGNADHIPADVPEADPGPQDM